MPGPVSVPVGRPVAVDAAREPDDSEAAHLAPVAVVVQVRVAHQVVVDVTQGHRTVEALVAVEAIAVEFILARQAVHLVIAQVTAVEAHGIACAQAVALVLAVGLAVALPHHDGGDVVVGFDVDAVASRTADDERQRGRGDFVDLAGVHAPDAQVDGARRQPHLRIVVVQVENLEIGARPEADGGTADLEFCACVAVGPEAVAPVQRSVALDADPVVFARRREADLAPAVIEAGDPSRRILVGGVRRQRDGQCEQQHARGDQETQ